MRGRGEIRLDEGLETRRGTESRYRLRGKPGGEGRIRKAVALSNLRNGIVEMEVRYECLRNNRTYSYPIYCIAAQVPAIRAPGL